MFNRKQQAQISIYLDIWYIFYISYVWISKIHIVQYHRASFLSFLYQHEINMQNKEQQIEQPQPVTFTTARHQWENNRLDVHWFMLSCELPTLNWSEELQRYNSSRSAERTRWLSTCSAKVLIKDSEKQIIAIDHP